MKKRKKVILSIICFTTGISTLLISQLYLKYHKTEKPISNNQQQKLFGEEKINAQTKVTNIIVNYLESIDNIDEYAKTNNIKKISLEKLSKEFKFSTKEFDNLEYKCKKESTMIIFNETFDKYFFTFDCESFYSDT